MASEATTASSTPVAAIFTQPAPLSATDDTKRPWQGQINLVGFSCAQWAAC